MRDASLTLSITLQLSGAQTRDLNYVIWSTLQNEWRAFRVRMIYLDFSAREFGE